MYTPPTKENWPFKIKYSKKYTDRYQEGYDAAKRGDLLKDNPYDNKNFEAYFFYNGFGNYIEWNNLDGSAIIL